MGDLAKATVGACALAAAELAAARGRPIMEPIHVEAARVATAFTSERHLRVGGRAFSSFAPESAFYPAMDGWVRTHGNYAHHRVRLYAALGDDIAGAIGGLPAEEVERKVTAVGGLAVAARSEAQWTAHPQGVAVTRLALVDLTETPSSGRATPPLPAGVLLPAAGMRVLDLTRVIAGPVATRTLAMLGADVLRVDCARYPEIEAQHLDTGVGKRSTLLDLTHAGDRAALERLLSNADAVVTGYRPGALDRHGLSPESLLERHPGLVVARLSAWGTAGPWAGRRGFDSLVQAASGIAFHEGSPGVLPAQALDHGTGYLLAAAVLRAWAARLARGGGHVAELALARTAAWLMSLPRSRNLPGKSPAGSASGGQLPGKSPVADRDNGRLPGKFPDLAVVALGGYTFAQPAVVLPGGPQTWTSPARPWGSDPPVWR